MERIIHHQVSQMGFQVNSMEHFLAYKFGSEFTQFCIQMSRTTSDVSQTPFLIPGVGSNNNGQNCSSALPEGGRCSSVALLRSSLSGYPPFNQPSIMTHQRQQQNQNQNQFTPLTQSTSTMGVNTTGSFNYGNNGYNTCYCCSKTCPEAQTSSQLGNGWISSQAQNRSDAHPSKNLLETATVSTNVMLPTDARNMSTSIFTTTGDTFAVDPASRCFVGDTQKNKKRKRSSETGLVLNAISDTVNADLSVDSPPPIVMNVPEMKASECTLPSVDKVTNVESTVRSTADLAVERTRAIYWDKAAEGCNSSDKPSSSSRDVTTSRTACVMDGDDDVIIVKIIGEMEGSKPKAGSPSNADNGKIGNTGSAGTTSKDLEPFFGDATQQVFFVDDDDEEEIKMKKYEKGMSDDDPLS